MWKNYYMIAFHGRDTVILICLVLMVSRASSDESMAGLRQFEMQTHS
jgi:hypothetical protein